MWNKEWIAYRGSVEIIADDQAVHRGFAWDARCCGDQPVMFIQCEDGRERTTHPRWVRPMENKR